MDFFGVSGPELGLIGLVGLLLLGPATMASALARVLEWRDRLNALRTDLIAALSPESGAPAGAGRGGELSAAARSWGAPGGAGSGAERGAQLLAQADPAPPTAPPVDEGADPER